MRCQGIVGPPRTHFIMGHFSPTLLTIKYHFISRVNLCVQCVVKKYCNLEIKIHFAPFSFCCLAKCEIFVRWCCYYFTFWGENLDFSSAYTCMSSSKCVYVHQILYHIYISVIESTNFIGECLPFLFFSFDVGYTRKKKSRKKFPFDYLFFKVVYLVSGIIVGGLGGCCGTIRPRRCGNDISPADLNDMMPVPLLISSPFECDVKHTRPPWRKNEK